MLDRLDQINLIIARTVNWFALLMALIQFGIVIGRYVFGINSIAVQESVLYLHASLFMLLAGYTLQVDGHVRVDIFYAKMNENGKRLIDLCGHIFFLIPSMLVLLYWSWPSVRNSWSIFEGPIAVGGIKAVFLMKSLIPIFCILLILQSLIQVSRLLLRRT